jgi:type I restriction enzyme R subunit
VSILSDGFIEEMKTQPSKTIGELFVFVDECHRTQSGKLHEAMKVLMPNATFISFFIKAYVYS